MVAHVYLEVIFLVRRVSTSVSGSSEVDMMSDDWKGQFTRCAEEAIKTASEILASDDYSVGETIE